MQMHNRAFTIVELVLVVAIVAATCLVAVPGLSLARNGAGLAGSLANLKKIGEVTGNYAADFDDQLWSFTWSPEHSPSEYEDLQDPRSNVTAAMYQATDIVRRLYHRDDFPKLDNRLPNYSLSMLVLADYLQETLPLEWMVSPGDKVRLEWQGDPDNPPQLNEQGGVAWAAIFAGFGSSYELMPAFFAPDTKVGNNQTIYQYKPNHKFSWIPSAVRFGGRRAAEVLYPSQKVHLAESSSFFSGPQVVYYLHAEARVPILMADGSASPRVTADANSSFRPNFPDDPEVTTLVDYVPNTIYDPPTLSGSEDSDLESHYKWTRHGLRGIDFSGERAE